MKNRIIEVTSNGAHISASRGFIKISRDGQNLGQVAVEDMAALIVRGYGATLSANICSRLAMANVPIVICGTNQAPDSVLWPLAGHHAQGRIMAAQSELSKPRRKRLWQEIVRAKIRTQAHVLGLSGKDSQDLESMAIRVKSGDQDNLEAQAARRYWTRLLGDEFCRSKGRTGNTSNQNAALNYGYTVLRAATARSIVGAGLHPSLSLHHESRGQALRLADDLMEPFRPWFDLAVFQNQDALSDAGLTPAMKSTLVSVLTLDLTTNIGVSPLQVCLDRLCQSLASIITGDCKKFDLPSLPKELVKGQEV